MRSCARSITRANVRSATGADGGGWLASPVVRRIIQVWVAMLVVTLLAGAGFVIYHQQRAIDDLESRATALSIGSIEDRGELERRVGSLEHQHESLDKYTDAIGDAVQGLLEGQRSRVTLPSLPTTTTTAPGLPWTPGATSGVTPSARCEDGTFSYSANRSGTCSSHGGVDTWLGGASP